MLNHYFTNNPIESNERTIDVNIFNKHLKFITDNGTFSKGGVDAESVILVETAPALEGDVLDLGCGWGFVGISLKFGNPNIKVLQTDVNSRAVALTRRNAALNAVTTDARTSDCFDDIHEQFNAIFLNPPIHAGRDTIYEMYNQSAQHLKPSGVLRVVMARKHGAESDMRQLRAIFGGCDVVFRKKGVYVFEAYDK